MANAFAQKHLRSIILNVSSGGCLLLMLVAVAGSPHSIVGALTIADVGHRTGSLLLLIKVLGHSET